jgi:hypothetical protein
VYDVLGRQVALLVDAPMPAGRHTAQFDGSALGSGIYIVQFQADGVMLSGKMMLVK